jgi:type II secretory pathway component PulF
MTWRPVATDMPNYLYKATDGTGKWLSGEIQGVTRAQAEARLLEQGLLVESLHEAEPAPSPRRTATNRAEVVELVEQLAALTRSGLPLPSGLRAAAGEVTSRGLRSSFFEIADVVESGGKLDDALARIARWFPADLRNLIAAGSRTGRLSEMLAQYVRNANLVSELREMFRLRLAYPTVGLVFVIVLVGFLCSLSTRAVVTLTGTMRDFGVDQSTMVRGIAAMARFINDHGLEMVFGLGAILILTWAAFRLLLGPARRRRIVCSIPVVGPVFRFTSLTEFCHLLAMLIESGTPLPLAFELAGSSVRDADVAEACGRMGRAIEEGEPLASAMLRWEALPAGLGQLFRWSQDRQNLPGALHLAGDMFESRARSQASYASNVLATMLLLLMLWWLGFAIAAFYLPLLSVINMLSRLSG